MDLRSHPLWLICAPLLLFAALGSYYRFMVLHDYTVEYRGACDTAAESCFTSCEDEACEGPSYYTKVTKYAPTVFRQCGANVSGCEAAGCCLFGEDGCSVEFCSLDALEEGEYCTGPLGEGSPQDTESDNVEGDAAKPAEPEQTL